MLDIVKKWLEDWFWLENWLPQPSLDNKRKKVIYLIQQWWFCVSTTVFVMLILDKISNKLTFWWYIGIASVIGIALAIFLLLKLKDWNNKGLVTSKCLVAFIVIFWALSTTYLGARQAYKSDYNNCYKEIISQKKISNYCNSISDGWIVKYFLL